MHIGTRALRGPLTATLLALAAACGGGPPQASGGGPSTAGDQGGTLTIGIVQEPTSFLAAGIVDAMQSSVVVDAPVAGGLLWYRPVDETRNARSLADFWRPMLATEVPTTDNGDVKTSGCRTVQVAGKDVVRVMCVTWRLRGDVLWHDGSHFGAHDVCATAQLFWLRSHDHNPTALVSTAGPDQLLDCHEDSPTQVTLSFRTGYGAYLSLGSGVYGILPAGLLENAFRTDADLERTAQTVDLRRGTGAPDACHGTDTLDRIIDGTGPYVLERDEPTREITLVRNRRHWDRSHPPHLDRIVFKVVSDVTSQLAQARAGEIDVGHDYRLALLPALLEDASQGRLQVQTVPEPAAEKMATAEPAVRRAILAAIDRAQLVLAIAHGQSAVPPDSWMSLGEEYLHDPAVPTTAYDPAAARRLLDGAGYHLSPACHDGRGRADPAGRCLDLDLVTTAGNTARQQARVAVQSDLEQVGIFTILSTVTAR